MINSLEINFLFFQSLNNFLSTRYCNFKIVMPRIGVYGVITNKDIKNKLFEWLKAYTLDYDKTININRLVRFNSRIGKGSRLNPNEYYEHHISPAGKADEGMVLWNHLDISNIESNN